MSEYLKRVVLSLNAIENLKKLRMLNYDTAKLVLGNPEKATCLIEQAVAVSKMFTSPFEKPDDSVDGLIKFALTENNIPIGINPEECHCLICGQTGCGKSTLLKILFSQALLFNRLQNTQYTSMENIICWLFVKAQDMRSLLKVNKDIFVVIFNMIKLNPLEPPPNMKEVEWASIFADIWIQAFRLYEGSKGFLIECLDNFRSPDIAP